jgi:hypothetical protein
MIGIYLALTSTSGADFDGQSDRVEREQPAAVRCASNCAGSSGAAAVLTAFHGEYFPRNTLPGTTAITWSNEIHQRIEVGKFIIGKAVPRLMRMQTASAPEANRFPS